MARIFARLGLIDRNRGSALPRKMICKAIILKRSPGPDGTDFDASDIASLAPVDLAMSARAGGLRPDDDFIIQLKPGTWDRLHLCLVDDKGIIFAMGALYAFGAKMLREAVVADHDGVVLSAR